MDELFRSGSTLANMGVLALLGTAVCALGWLAYQAYRRAVEAADGANDRLVEEVRKQVAVAQADRDYWRDLAQKGAETARKTADHIEDLTSILERAIGGKVSP